MRGWKGRRIFGWLIRIARLGDGTKINEKISRNLNQVIGKICRRKELNVVVVETIERKKNEERNRNKFTLHERIRNVSEKSLATFAFCPSTFIIDRANQPIDRSLLSDFSFFRFSSPNRHVQIQWIFAFVSMQSMFNEFAQSHCLSRSFAYAYTETFVQCRRNRSIHRWTTKVKWFGEYQSKRFRRSIQKFPNHGTHSEENQSWRRTTRTRRCVGNATIWVRKSSNSLSLQWSKLFLCRKFKERKSVQVSFGGKPLPLPLSMIEDLF